MRLTWGWAALQTQSDRGEGAAPGWGTLSTPLPCGLGPAELDQARLDPTRRQSTRCHYGGLRWPSFAWFGLSVSSHRTRVRKASQRFVSLNAFNTEETNQRFRQSRAKVPSSNQWMITQPTPRLHLTRHALKGVLSPKSRCAARLVSRGPAGRRDDCRSAGNDHAQR